MQLYFPHENIRESQKELIDKIQEAISKKTNLIAHAPTGLGKTAASISVALSLALENKLTVFFITPKHTQHRIAVETLKLIKEKYNLDFGVVDLIGKKWMCAQEGVNELTTGEFYDYCKDMISKKQCIYYENIKNKDKLSVQTEVVLSELSKKILHVEEFKEHAKNNKLCPFEIACLVGKKATVIIGDYHHILSPSIRETLIERIDKDLSNSIIIIDEAHNLPNRCRELLSSQLSSVTVDFAIKEAELVGFKDMGESIKIILNCLEELKRLKLNRESREALIDKSDLLRELEKQIDVNQLIGDLLFIGEKIREVKKRSACSSVASFLINWQGPDESFTRFIKLNKNDKGKEYLTIYYNCLDPSLIMMGIAENCYSTICMSGTLTPLDMYKDLFGFTTIAEEFKNPFPKHNKLSIIVPETTTKFTARSQDMFKHIANYCASIVNEVPGNCLIFFPSYDLRDKVNFYFQNQCIKTTFSEISNMNKIEKNELLEKFKSYKENGAVLLAASGGNFGEGVDIEDNILKCVVVVGVPLDKPDLETQELIKYYDKKFSKGWDYGYIMPAMIKCLQNAGRCIRSEKDKGVVVFLDQRYTWESYFKCFPKDGNLRISKEPINRIREFFNNSDIKEN